MDASYLSLSQLSSRRCKPASHSSPGVLLDAVCPDLPSDPIVSTSHAGFKIPGITEPKPSIARGAGQEGQETQAECRTECRKRKFTGPEERHRDGQSCRETFLLDRGKHTLRRAREKLYHPRPITPNLKLEAFLESFSGLEPRDFNPEGVSSFVSDWVNSLGNELQRAHSAPVVSDNPSASGISCAARALPHASSAPASMPPKASTASAPSGTGPFTDEDRQSSRTSLTKKKVDANMYREDVLRQHGYFFASRQDPLPSHLAHLVGQMASGRSSPGPAMEDITSDTELEALWCDGLSETQVQWYFDRTIFFLPHGDARVQVNKGQIMLVSSLPQQRGDYRMSCPKPDLAFGYSYHAFTSDQKDTLVKIGDRLCANSSRLYFPYLVVEYKADTGSIHSATNQCMNTSAACMNLVDMANTWAEDLQTRQPTSSVTPIGSTVFSVAMTSSEANIFVSFKSGGLGYTHRIACFNVQDSRHYIEFRRMVRNIIDWGRGPRLVEVQRLLDQLTAASKNA